MVKARSVDKCVCVTIASRVQLTDVTGVVVGYDGHMLRVALQCFMLHLPPLRPSFIARSWRRAWLANMIWRSCALTSWWLMLLARTTPKSLISRCRKICIVARQ